MVRCCAILALSLLQQAAVRTPRIEVRGTEATLLLPSAMAAALKKFDPDFKPRRVSAYPVWVLQGWYKLTPQQAPFAAVGDFNGDNVLDVVVDGDNQDRGRRVAILSGAGGFQVSELKAEEHISKQIEGRGGRGVLPGSRRDGLESGLSLVTRDTVRSPLDPTPLVLTSDAFREDFWEKASVVRYYRDGSWHEYWTSN